MPELPDVENYKRYLDATCLHKRIEGVRVHDERFLKELSGRELAGGLRGRAFASTHRHGKNLLIALDDGGWLASHYGMTGGLRYFKALDKDSDHDRVHVDFDNGYHLAFVSKRMLGYVRLVDDADRFIESEGLGTDALEMAVDEERFRESLAHKRGGLKSALMDQRFIAGLGNVYSDEILFRARLQPEAKVQELKEREAKRLFEAMGEVLRTAIDSGAGSEDFIDKLPRDYLLPHRQRGAKCPRCGGKIETRKVSGRTTYMCPRCQR